ncbi:MAG: hypothetical protein OHK005_13260 [Candidatus Methylacidiphilales bacterium]
MVSRFVMVCLVLMSTASAADTEGLSSESNPSEVGRGEPITLAKSYAMDRYQPLLESNPFTLIKPETESAPDFARNLSLIGLMRTGGKTTALLFDLETRSRILVSETPDPKTGIRIESVSLAPRHEEVTVALVKGAERGTVRFNKDAMALAASGGAGPQILGGPAATSPGGPRPPQAGPDGTAVLPQPRIIRRPIRRVQPVPDQ